MVRTAARTARLVLVTPNGDLVGSLPPLDVATPWWPDVEPVVRAARDQYGVEVTVLRLLEAERATPHGGAVTYLAEVPHALPADPWPGALDDQPLRQSYARPGGPAADLAWAETVLVERGLRPTGAPVQVKTWNLSSLWRLPVEGQTAWLKVVPPFFVHEGPLLARLAGQSVPRLLGESGGRMLLAEIPGRDLVDAQPPVLCTMVSMLVGMQRAWTSGLDELLALGVPDWRGSVLTSALAEVVERTSAALSAADRATLADFVRTLAERLGEVSLCGVPDSLIHGDFWPGNVRGDAQTLTLLDWGDSGVGHPLLDQSAFLDRIPRGSVDAITQHWVQEWRAAVPDSDPARAFMLLAPVAAARLAAVYQRFLDQIEPSEHPYHRADPADQLQKAAALLRSAR